MKFKPLQASDIECRVGTINNKGLSLLLYKDARCDMKLLDEVVGMEFWQREHKEVKGNVYCGVSIYLNLGTSDNPDMQWVTKWDAGAESYTEKVKGEASDSFKRACFNWGIGRELYTSPFIWIKPDSEKEIFKNNKDKYMTYSKFSVSEIGYEDETISYLVIVDQNGKVRYKFGNLAPLNKNLVNKLLDINMSMSDTYKWADYYNVKYEETDTLGEVCSRFTEAQANFIISRFQKKENK